MKAIFKFLALVMLLGIFYSGGYVSREYGPPVNEVLADAGIDLRIDSPRRWTVSMNPNTAATVSSHQSPRWERFAQDPSYVDPRSTSPVGARQRGYREPVAEPAPSTVLLPITIDGEAYEARAGVRQVIAELLERTSILNEKRKEKETACNLYLGRGEGENSTRIQSLRAEQMRIDRSIETLAGQLEEARDLELGLQRVINAAVEIDASYVDEADRLRDARRLLSR